MIMQKLKNVVKSIDVEFTDIKAEVVIADIHEHHVDFNNIEVKFDGTFERNYKKDINSLRVDMVKKAISLHVTRNSLYDVLPEGLFHPVTRFGGLDSKELLFPNKTSIPRKYYRQLLKYLPFTNYFKGNPELTAQCLSEIIDEKVMVDSSFMTNVVHNPDDFKSSGLGIMGLGEDFICGDSLLENVPAWSFTIDIENETGLQELVDPDKGSVLKELLDYFYRYFVPFEVVIETKVVCSNQQPLVLSGGEDAQEAEQGVNNLYLGYNTSI